jgi:hypothetical protein
MKFGSYPKAGSFRSAADFSAYLAAQAMDMPCDEVVEAGPNQLVLADGTQRARSWWTRTGKPRAKTRAWSSACS